MIAIIDFDYTLFDTTLLKQATDEVFLQYGIRTEDNDRTYEKVLQWTAGDVGYDYSFEKQVDALAVGGYELPRDRIVAELYDCVKRDFLYEDALSFLTCMRDHVSDLILMTAGNKHFQQTKVQRVDIEDYFTDHIYINGDKHRYIAEHFADRDVIFVNDNLKENNLVKEAMPSAHVITKLRTKHYTRDDAEKSGIPHFETLTQIQDYVTHKLI